MRKVLRSVLALSCIELVAAGSLAYGVTSTSLSLSSSPNPSTYGSSVTFTATITPSAATGTVTFFDSGKSIGTGTLSGGTATLSISTLAVGTHQIVASYPGNSSYSSSKSSTLTQTVVNPTTLTLTSSPNPSTYGSSVTFTATITPSAATGTVTFFDSGKSIGSGTLSGGTASLSISTLLVGPHEIVASYPGNSTYNGSTSSQLQQIVVNPTTLALTSSPNPSTYGSSVTFTGTVTPSAATGTVTFFDAGRSIGSGTLSGGTATLSISTLLVGPHTILASYSGSSTYNSSTSSQLQQIVNVATSSTAVTSSLNPSVYGSAVTFTATVTPSTATGTVAFLDGGVSIGTGTLSSGTATFTTSALAAGSHSITASYGGDSNDSASTSSPLTQTVQASSVPTITSFSPSSASVGTVIGVTGTNLTATGATPVVTLAAAGGGTIGAAVTGASPTNLSFVVPTGAATGPITVTVNGQSGSSSAPLTIVAASSFTLTAAPSSVTLLPGQTTTVSVSLASSNGFTQLAALAISGLPSGVAANFQPQSITAGGLSLLTLSAPAGQTPTISPLSITASATVQGIAESQSATVTLTVEGAGSVAFQGRVAVTNPSLDIPLVGVTVRFLGLNYTGASTGCSASTQTDSAGNFIFPSLPSACSGSQMVQYDPSTVSSPPGSFSGVNLSYVFTPGQVTTPGLVIHLPNVATVETVQVQQNSSTDQTFVFKTIPGVVITVYAGTTLSLSDGTQPNPFPLSVVEIPYEQVPDYMPPSPTQDPVFAMSIEPYNSSASQPVAVSFPNRSNLPPGTAMPLTSLNPTLGMMVAYGTGTVSADGSQVVPNLDPNYPGHLYGISHFDWHFPLPQPNKTNPSPDPNAEHAVEPVDLASGLQVLTHTDIAFGGARGQIAITRTFRGATTNQGPFGIGTNHSYGYILDMSSANIGLINLIMPDGNQFPFVAQSNGTYINTTIPSLQGAVINPGAGSLRWKDGTIYQFQGLYEDSPSIWSLVSIADPNNNTTTLVHDPNTPIEIDQITDPVGRSLNLTYDSTQRITSISDPIGRTVQYTYNPQGYLSAVTDAKGGVTTYAYDSNNNLTSITDPRGITFLQNTYDQNGRVIKQVAADGGITTFSYTQLNPTIATSPVAYTVVTDPPGNQTTYHFNPAGYLLDMTDALGQKTIYARDPASNQLMSAIDTLGRTTAFTYDSNGNTTSITKLAGTPGAVTTSYTYDPTFNRLTSITDPLGHTTSMKYDSAGNARSVTDALGDQTSYAYDNSGELTSVTDPMGNTTQFAYTNGDLVSTTDPLGRVTARVSDSVSRLIVATNPLGQTTRYQYDPLDEVTQVVDPQGNATQLAYDGNGNLTSVTDALGHATTYTYNSMDRRATRTDPLGHAESYQYDQNGNLTQRTDRRGVTTTYSYDALNRKVQASFGGQSSITYTYDAVSRLTQAVDSITGTVARGYDALNRLTSEVTPQGSISYGYDAAGRRTAMSASGQTAVSYAYDNANGLTQITQGSSGVAFNYDASGRLTVLTLPNGVTMSHSYDVSSQLVGINYQMGNTVLGNLTYTYDLAGRRTTAGGTYAQTSLPSAVASGSFNADDQMTQFGTSNFTYDANGNLTSDGTHTYSWDARNHLVSISGAVSASFQYDAFGRRVSKTIGAVMTNYLYDGVNPVQELSGGSPTANLLTGLGVDQRFQRTDGSSSANFLTDALGSTIALTGPTGNTLAQYKYDPFGNVTITGTSSNPYQFTGRENDGTGLYYYRARYYNPSIGRFISEDPVRSKDGVNYYQYALNDPVGLTDPMGEDACLNINAFVNYMNANYSKVRTSSRNCAPAVKAGLAHGFDVTVPQLGLNGGPQNYGPGLEALGFKDLYNSDNPSPMPALKAGDIMIFQAIPGHAYGHIQMWNGSEWVSDFGQNSSTVQVTPGYPGPGSNYESANPPFSLYRDNSPCP